MGKKDLCAAFGCNNDRLFSEKFTVKDYISNTKLKQGDHYYIQTRYKDLFSHSLENTNEMCSYPLGIL